MRLSLNATALIAFAVLMFSYSWLTRIESKASMRGAYPVPIGRAVIIALAGLCLLAAMLHSTV